MFQTDADRLRFLLEAEAEFHDFLAEGDLSAEAEDRPKYITNYIGSKQKLTDWIWKSTPDDLQTAADAFSGSSVVGYMYKTHGLGVQASDRLAYCNHIARAIVENDSTTLSDEEIDAVPLAFAERWLSTRLEGMAKVPAEDRLRFCFRDTTDPLRSISTRWDDVKALLQQAEP